MAVELWETLKESITVYTGLSPATFFTVVALGLAIYYVVSGLFGSSDNQHHARPRDFAEEMQPLPPPVQLGEISEEELKGYDGADPKKPLLMAIKGQIYDVSQSRMFYGPGGPYALFAGKDASRALAKMMFYGPGGPYALFAGKDASRALAKMSFEDKDLNGDLTGLGVFELEALQDWEYKFMSKYVKVGTIKQTVPVTDGSITTASTEPTETHDPDVKSAEAAPSENVDAEPKETATAGEADKE